MEETRTFETTNVDLATFLVMEGIQLLEFTYKDRRKSIVVIRFIDDLGKCSDLERVYMNSEYKRFRDINKWLLSKIHDKLREERNGPKV
jgi:hypothetical protein